VIPSVVAAQLQDSLVDYVLASLALEDEGFERSLEAALRGPDGLFRGPYLRLGLPFASAPEGASAPLTIAPDFQPYVRLSTTIHPIPPNTSLLSGSCPV